MEVTVGQKATTRLRAGCCCTHPLLQECWLAPSTHRRRFPADSQPLVGSPPFPTRSRPHLVHLDGLKYGAHSHTMSDPLSLSLDLLRRLPPSNISNNLDALVALCPALADDLYSSVDQPLRVRIDSSKVGAGREYLACDYNRDGDSWRSPWSNEYDPPLEDGTRPSKPLRDLELRMGAAMDTYRQLYYDTGLSSVYLWDLDDGAFAGVVLLKKGELKCGGQCSRLASSTWRRQSFQSVPQFSTISAADGEP